MNPRLTKAGLIRPSRPWPISLDGFEIEQQDISQSRIFKAHYNPTRIHQTNLTQPVLNTLTDEAIRGVIHIESCDPPGLICTKHIEGINTR